MAWMNAREIASLRVTTTSVLTDLCTVRVPTQTPDGVGGVTTVWADTPNVPCRISPTARLARVGTVGDVFAAVSGWVLTVAYNQTLAPGYRIVKGGLTYIVQSVENDRTDPLVRRANLGRAD